MHPILPAVLLLFGLVLLYGGVRNYRRERAALSWPGVQGVITDSRLGRRNKGQVVSVWYAYEVDGVTHNGREESTWTDHSTSQSRQRKRQKIADSYVSGESITVFHDPKDPKFSTIAPGHGGDTLFSLLVGLGLTAAGVVLLYYQL